MSPDFEFLMPSMPLKHEKCDKNFGPLCEKVWNPLNNLFYFIHLVTI